MPSSTFPQKGRALLLSTAAAGVALGVAFTASPTFAANDCGPVSGNAVTCTSAGNPYANGITYTATGAPITVTADNTVAATGPIRVTATGGAVDIENAGTVTTAATTANGGVDGEATGGNVLINNSGAVTTTGTNIAGLYGSATGGTVTINNASVVTSTGNAISAISDIGTTITNSGALTAGGNGYAIYTAGAGAATITNSGVMNGPINLTSVNNSLTNTGQWNVSGDSNFGGSGTNVFNNGGTLVVDPNSLSTPVTAGTPQPTLTTFSGLTTFNNNGSIDVRPGNDLNIGSAVLNAGSGSQLLVNANAPDGVLTVGSTGTGVTSVMPLDVLGTAPGKLNLGGTLLVVNAGQGSFDLNGNPNNIYHKGFVDYELVYAGPNGTNPSTYTLYGLPGREVFEALSIPQAAQTFWKNSADAWTQRAMEIRDTQVGQSPSRAEGWEVWLQPYGGHSDFERPQVFTFNGFDFHSIGTNTAFFGLQAGADVLTYMGNGYGYWGFTGGLEHQETTFNNDNENDLYLTGGNLGMYGGINWGGFYFDGMGKVDFINLNANFNSAGFSPSTSWMTWGGKGEIGYRWPVWGFFVEPAARVAGIWTESNNLFPAGGVLNFHDDDPVVQGEVGGRVGTTLGFFGFQFTAYGGAFWADQWSGKDGLSFATGTDLSNDSVSMTQRQAGSFTRVEYGVETGAFYGGLKGFLKGENDFAGDGVGGWASQMGVRFSF